MTMRMPGVGSNSRTRRRMSVMLQRIVIGPARALLLACLGVQGAEPDEELHVGKPCVPALPLAECDPAAELGNRVIDTPFERENGGSTPAPLGFEKRHLAGCTSKT